MTSLDLGGFALLIAITSLLTAAMLIGWLTFGRMPHALLWALAAAGEAGQWVINALTFGEASAIRPVLLTTSLVSIVDSVLILTGVLLRGRRQVPFAAIAAAGGAVMLVCIWVLYGADPPRTHVRGVLVNLFVAVMFIWSALAIRSGSRRANIAEYGAVGAMLLFAAYQFALAGIWGGAAGDVEGVGARLYASVLIIGLPVAYVATGIAGILLIASDLYGRLQALATRDPRTGAYNRRGFEQAMVPALAAARRRRRPLALVVLDVGGAARSAERLRTVADALNAAIREEDVFAHLGEGEFCVLLIDTDAAAAREMARRMRDALVGVDAGGHAGLQIAVAEIAPGELTIGPLIRRVETMIAETKLAARAARPEAAPDRQPRVT